MSEYKQSESLDCHVLLPEPERITVCGNRTMNSVDNLDVPHHIFASYNDDRTLCGILDSGCMYWNTLAAYADPGRSNWLRVDLWCPKCEDRVELAELSQVEL